MANKFKSDSLITVSNGEIMIDVDCFNGYPSMTSVFLKMKNNTEELIKEFKGDKKNISLGLTNDLFDYPIVIYTTVYLKPVNLVNKFDDVNVVEICVYEKEHNKVCATFTKGKDENSNTIIFVYTISLF